jgi:hypothetical protein
VSEDERDIEELLMVIPARKYAALRAFVRRRLGYPSAARLDALARRIGHPGPGMKRRYG